MCLIVLTIRQTAVNKRFDKNNLTFLAEAKGAGRGWGGVIPMKRRVCIYYTVRSCFSVYDTFFFGEGGVEVHAVNHTPGGGETYHGAQLHHNGELHQLHHIGEVC